MRRMNMKLQIVTDDGVLILTIEDMQLYDLSKPGAVADVIEDIAHAIASGMAYEPAPEQAAPGP
jgi:hypothetical protein